MSRQTVLGVAKAPQSSAIRSCSWNNLQLRLLRLCQYCRWRCIHQGLRVGDGAGEAAGQFGPQVDPLGPSGIMLPKPKCSWLVG